MGFFAYIKIKGAIDAITNLLIRMVMEWYDAAFLDEDFGEKHRITPKQRATVDAVHHRDKWAIRIAGSWHSCVFLASDWHAFSQGLSLKFVIESLMVVDAAIGRRCSSPVELIRGQERQCSVEALPLHACVFLGSLERTLCIRRVGFDHWGLSGSKLENVFRVRRVGWGLTI